MTNSIRMKLFRWHVFLVLVIILSTFIGMTLFSETLYKQKTLKLLSDEAVQIESFVKDGDLDRIYDSIDDSAFRIGATIFLYDNEDRLLYSSYQMAERTGFGMGRGRNNPFANNGTHGHSGNFQTLEAVRTAAGKNLLTYNYDLEEAGYLSMQMPGEKIEDALWVFQQLLLYVAVIAILVSVVVSMIISRHFSRPIVALKDLAHNISKLDFSGSYSENRSDEIGELGRHLNVLSRELENKIKQLELELQKEKTMDSMRTQFVAQASHELKTPLTVLRNYIEAIDDGMVASEEMQEHLAVMLEEVDDMSGLVTGMLDLNQLRSGQFKIHFERFELTALLTSEVNRLKDSLKTPHTILEIAVEEKETWIYGDAKRIKQAFRNLVENGFKHASGRVRIGGERRDGYYRIAIENSGEKIPESELSTLWEVFYKANGNYKSGTGLGLAIVKEIIEGHKGRYGIENIEDGVRSYFELKIDG